MKAPKQKSLFKRLSLGSICLLCGCSYNATVLRLADIPPKPSGATLLGFDENKARGYIQVGKYDVARGAQNCSCWFGINPVPLTGLAAYSLPPGTYLVTEEGGSPLRPSYVVHLKQGDRKFVVIRRAGEHQGDKQDGVPALFRELGFEEASDIKPSDQDVLNIMCAF